jgi:hypothetical protein
MAAERGFEGERGPGSCRRGRPAAVHHPPLRLVIKNGTDPGALNEFVRVLRRVVRESLERQAGASSSRTE